MELHTVKGQKWKSEKEGTPLIPLVGKPIVGQKYHVTWGLSKGVVGRCYEVNEYLKTVLLERPSTRKPFKNPVPWSQLLHLRVQQFRIEQGLNPYE
tara:strand:- start:5807 stop:6094 length:288 start_codon:yes stop_codon:yes gene_type:complete